METQEVSETTPQAAPQSIEEHQTQLDQGTPAPQETAAAPDQASQAQPAPQAATSKEGEAPKYEPNYKFTIGDKEHEFDEFLRTAIKDKDTEEQLRQLYTRAHGLDAVKERNKQTQEYLKVERQEKEQLQGFYKELDGYINQRDFGAFLERTGIDKNLVFEWVKQELEYQELDPQKKYAYDRDREFRKNSYAESARLQHLEKQNQQILTQQRNFELDAALSKPEIAEVAKAFDEASRRNGTPSFREEVIQRGIAKFYATKQDTPAEVLVSEMAKMFSHMAMPKASVPQPTPAPQTVVTAKPPVIPHVGGGNTSPVERQVRTLEDLEKVRNEHFAR